MRVLLLSLPTAFVLIVILGSPALLGGCSTDSTSDGSRIDVDVQEQSLLQERIQKGISKRPVTKTR